ncbi:MAG: hypothetical protein HLX50_01220 [Alteromonadaceae bacterium]|nr:hypothetical protein [Alteromonadaceae bacterium]
MFTLDKIAFLIFILYVIIKEIAIQVISFYWLSHRKITFLKDHRSLTPMIKNKLVLHRGFFWRLAEWSLCSQVGERLIGICVVIVLWQ